MYYQVLMITKMSKPEISGKILKRKEVIIRITQKQINRHPGYGLSFKPNMKQICESVKDLETDTGFWRPSWFVKLQKKITRQIPQGQYAYFKYLEIIQTEVFEWEQTQVAAGGPSKNSGGWRLNKDFKRETSQFCLQETITMILLNWGVTISGIFLLVSSRNIP